MSKSIEFPAGFLWGTATSAHQIEGSPLADGAGPSIWQRFSHTPNLVRDGDTGDVACDHYRRYAEDVADALARHQRLSLGIAGHIRNGRGAVKVRGQARPAHDALLESGIAPMATCSTGTAVSATAAGGSTPTWLTGLLTTRRSFRLDDRVKLWSTLNEPWVVTDGGYLYGALAPGHRSRFEAPIATHNLLRSHGKAVQAYRSVGRHQVGIVVNIEPKYAASEADEDVAATTRADAYMNLQYLDPVFLGRYPDALAEVFGEAWPRWPAEDMALIRQPIDFVGINYYTRSVTRHDHDHWLLHAAPVRQRQATYTETGWEVFPQGLIDTLVRVKERYGNPPIYITENGAAFFDPPTADGGRVQDPLRVAYLRAHLRAIHAAMGQGVDLRGYFAWSLLDNFEWSLGYSKRFGIVHVDFATQQRTPKDSARFYAEVIATNGKVLESAV
jgi:beta-glucosidase